MGRKKQIESNPFGDDEKLCLQEITQKMANPIDYECSKQEFQAKLKQVYLVLTVYGTSI